jgi:hypothetical protein
MMVQIRFTQSARKHRVGRESARHVMEHHEPGREEATSERSARLYWVGMDERRRELEIVAIVEPDYLLVVHVMPTHYRRQR